MELLPEVWAVAPHNAMQIRRGSLLVGPSSPHDFVPLMCANIVSALVSPQIRAADAARNRGAGQLMRIYGILQTLKNDNLGSVALNYMDVYININE